jgi:hypothetical protein
MPAASLKSSCPLRQLFCWGIDRKGEVCDECDHGNAGIFSPDREENKEVSQTNKIDRFRPSGVS